MRFILIASLVLIFPATVHAGECDLRGHWEGNLSHRDRDYPLVLDISCQDESHTISLDLPEYLIYGSDTEVSEDDERLTIKSAMMRGAKITLNLQADRLVGKCEDFRDVISDVSLRRTHPDPMLYEYADVSFESGDATLKGTLVKPAGYGSLPTIVWTHGSGSDTRETFYYSGRAHLMAQHGFASLIYDKRGAGESSGSRSWDIDLLIEDALTAVATIKARADVKRSAIGIAGFSQGGWIAPAVAARDDDVAFVVVGATPVVTAGEQNIFSMVNRMRRDGESEETVAAAEQFVTRLYTFYQDGENRDAMVAALEQATDQPWFKNKWLENVLFIPGDGLPAGPNPSWSPYSPDPRETWRRVTVPVLSMWGAGDIDVPVELSRSRLEKALKSNGNEDFRLEIFANASHGMWREKPADLDWDWPRQAREAQQLMVDWVIANIAVGNPR